MAQPVLTYAAADRNGDRPSPDLLNVILRHRKNGKEYVIRGFAWNGCNDTWGFLHSEIDQVSALVWRPMKHLSDQRFELVGKRVDVPEIPA